MILTRTQRRLVEMWEAETSRANGCFRNLDSTLRAGWGRRYICKMSANVRSWGV